MNNKNKIKKILIIFFIYSIKSNESDDLTIEGYFKRLMNRQDLRGVFPIRGVFPNPTVTGRVFWDREKSNSELVEKSNSELVEKSNSELVEKSRENIKHNVKQIITFEQIHQFFLDHVSLFLIFLYI